VFSAGLSHNSLFTPLNVVSGIAFVPEVMMIVGCSLTAVDSNTKNTSQLYLSSIDAVVLTVLTLIFTIWSLKRPAQDQGHNLA
jgi:cytochrome bd-type quinol oxidase subunit 2